MLQSIKSVLVGLTEEGVRRKPRPPLATACQSRVKQVLT
jgi:hypothetical protein